MHSKISQLDTPCLLLNKCKLLNNLQLMQDKLDSHNRSAEHPAQAVQLRHHGKTAKNVNVAKLFRAPHNEKITVSTLKEAQYYLSHGYTDLVYAVGIVPDKLSKVADMLTSGAHIKLIVDSHEQVAFVADFAKQREMLIELLIEVDCDDERAGLRIDDPSFVPIAKAIQNAQWLRFKGIMTHAGGSYHCQSRGELITMAEQERQVAVKAAALLEQHNMQCDIVSVGSTPTATFADNFHGITEVRAGVFVFQDLVMAGLGVCQFQDIAMSVLCSVIGKNSQKNWLLIDAGWMALSRDRGTQGQKVDYAYGKVGDLGGQPLGNLVVNRTNQEHGIIELDEAHQHLLRTFPIGQKLRIYPNHACATAAMHDRYYVTENELDVCDVWHRVNGW